MVTDHQVRLLMRTKSARTTLSAAAAKSGMSEKTARKYLQSGKLPSEMAVKHDWQLKEDPFAEVWECYKDMLAVNPGLEATTLFEDLRRKHPGRFADGQLRTFQRRVKHWRATEGPDKEIFFAQNHVAGRRSQSDFTSMNSVGITIQGRPFRHLLYHFVLTYSNWETGTICFSESFESLSTGLQNALWVLGGVPKQHQTDRLGAAVKAASGKRGEFQQRYAGLLAHYKLDGRMTQARSPHENGDIEQRHHRLKRAIAQSLMLRGSFDFNSRQDYQIFLDKLFAQLNSGRTQRFHEELEVLGQLPLSKLDARKRLNVKVTRNSTIRVNHNVYSVPSRLRDQQVKVMLNAEDLDLYYGSQYLETIPRQRGESRHHIQYRHIIDWLVRKPGAFANYCYREDLFPTHRYRMAYDDLLSRSPSIADKTYLKILHLAAHESETQVDKILEYLLARDIAITANEVASRLRTVLQSAEPYPTVLIENIDLSQYDNLSNRQGAVL